MGYRLGKRSAGPWRVLKTRLYGTIWPCEWHRSGIVMRELGGRLAIVLHIYYLDIAERLLSQLRWLASSDRFALWVTVPSGKRADVEALLSRYGLAAQVRDYPNTGMDVLPFLRVLPELAEAGYS